MKEYLSLIKELNKEYRTKPVTNPPKLDDNSRFAHAESKIKAIDKLVDFSGKQVLEIGCGTGHNAYYLSKNFDCQVTAIDVNTYDDWRRFSLPNLTFIATDLSKKCPFEKESFDIIFSIVVWEHLEHPFKMLSVAADLLKVNGAFYLYANLYRSALASHLYRDIFFPYPHLVFPREALDAYIRECEEKGIRDMTVAKFVDNCRFVNKLTYSHYLQYFSKLGLKIRYYAFTKRQLDEVFYQRFKSILSQYPKWDLETDFFRVVLTKSSNRHLARGVSRTILLSPTWMYPKKDDKWNVSVSGEGNLTVDCRMSKEDKFYIHNLQSNFSKPPADIENWRMKPNRTYEISITAYLSRGNPCVQLWIIEYTKQGPD